MHAVHPHMRPPLTPLRAPRALELQRQLLVPPPPQALQRRAQALQPPQPHQALPAQALQPRPLLQSATQPLSAQPLRTPRPHALPAPQPRPQHQLQQRQRAQGRQELQAAAGNAEPAAEAPAADYTADALRAQTRLAAHRRRARLDEERAAADDASGSDDDDNNADRGDILMIMRQVTVTDVAVVSPTAASHVATACLAQYNAAHKKDRAKHAKYRSRGRLAGRFVPLSIETYGTMGRPFTLLLVDLARRAAPPGLDAAERQQRFLMSAFQEISVALATGNGLTMRAGQRVLARASGRAVRAGMDIASDDVAHG